MIINTSVQKTPTTLIILSVISVIGIMIALSTKQQPQSNPFKSEEFLKQKEYVLKSLVHHPATKSISGCINGVAFELAGMNEQSKQYLKDYPACTKVLLRNHEIIKNSYKLN